jgi:hypothetical protein
MWPRALRYKDTINNGAADRSEHGQAAGAIAQGLIEPHRLDCWLTSLAGFTPMDALALFGLVAVTAMLIFYALEDHSPWFILAFAGACVLASAYGFLQGAWPFGIIEVIWAGVAVRRWRNRTLTVTVV